MANDPRAKASGRGGVSSQTEPITKPDWLQPNPAQTGSNGGLLLEESNSHRIAVQQSIEAAQNVAKDVAARNIQNLAKQNPQFATQNGQLPQYGPGWWDSLKNGLSHFIGGIIPSAPAGINVSGADISAGPNVTGEVAAGLSGIAGIPFSGQDVLAPSQRDPLLRTAYATGNIPGTSQFNTQLAVNRALSQHPELITKPYLLFSAAMKDMDAHDIKYMSVMDDMMRYYNTAIMNGNGLQQAAQSMTDRIQNTANVHMAEAIGQEFHNMTDALGWVGSEIGDGQRWLEKTFVELGGGTATESTVDGRPMLAVTQGTGLLGDVTGLVTDVFGTAADAGRKTWEILDSNLFGIQHAIRTEDHIRRTQGDDAANEYIGAWFGTAVMLNYAGRGLGVALRGVEKVALRRMLEKAGVSTDVATSLMELQQLAKVSNMDNEKWLRVTRASQDWLMHKNQQVPLLPTKARIAAIANYARFGAQIPEEASWSQTVGGAINRYGAPFARMTKDFSTYGMRHWHVPLNLELSAQLLAETNGFGIGNGWDKAWAATADGEKYVDPITHRPKAVSFGRMVAGAVPGLEENTWWYNRVSGALDFLSWFEFDPFQSILAPISETKQLVNEGTFARSYPGQGVRSRSDVYRVFATKEAARRFASDVVERNRSADPYLHAAAETARASRNAKIEQAVARWRRQGLTQAQIDARLLGSTKLRPLTEEEALRAAVAISPQASSMAGLVKSYPHLVNIIRPDELASGDTFIQMLSHARTEDEVIEIFAAAAEAQSMLEVRSMSRSRFLTFKDYLRNQAEKAVTDKSEELFNKGKYGEAATVGLNSRRYRAFVSVRPEYWEEFKKFSNKVVRVGDPKSLDMLSRAWRASGINPLTVDLLINRLAMTRNSQEWSRVYTNWVKDTFNLYIDSHLQSTIVNGELNARQATQIRNIVLKQFQEAIDELGNPFGGGAANRVYSGADINKIVDPKVPFPNNTDMEATAGVGAKNEHYLAIPDYASVDSIINDLKQFLRSGEGERAVYSRVEQMVAGPYDRQIVNIERQQEAIVNNLARTAPMRKPEEDATWLAFQEQKNDIVAQRKQAIEDAVGNRHFFSYPQKAAQYSGHFARYLHDGVRHHFIDNFFRKLVLATGSFSMRVSASEAIANAFRLGPVEYTKATLFSHLDTAVKNYEKAYKVSVSPEEMGILQRWVYNKLRYFDEDLEFYTQTLRQEGVRLTKRMEKDFFTGLLGGKNLDDFIQLIAKDTLINGTFIGGLSADEAGVYGGGMDSVEATMRNITSGRGTGTWEAQSNVDRKSMTDMTKVLTDIATDNMQRGVATILDNYLNPNSFIGWSFERRLDTAIGDVQAYVRHMVNRNPSEFDNMKRMQRILTSTRDRIKEDILAENGLPLNATISDQRLLDELKDRLSRINPLDEWANATIQHVLWATHGRGANGGFDFPNLGDRVFHRRVLSMLARGEYPHTAVDLERLYLTPDLEHARVMQHRKAAKPKGGEAPRYHETLYDPTYRYGNEATFDPREFADTATATTPEELQNIKDQLISAHRPRPAKRLSKARRDIKKQSDGIVKRYADYSGSVVSMFPDRIPGQTFKNNVSISSSVDWLSNMVHDKVSRKIIDSVSRRPLYYLELKRQMDILRPFVASGALAEETAFTMAQSRAIGIGIKFVHNPQDRLVFEQWSRAYAPFWFAENQALKRMGRMALQNPAGFEQYMLTQLMLQHASKRSIENLDNQGSTLLPGSVAGGQMFTSFLHSFMGLGASGNVPIGLTGSLTSLNSVFPWNDPTGMHTGSPMALLEHLRPQFSPVVSIPLKILQQFKPYGVTVPEQVPFIGGDKISSTGLAESVLGDVGANADWLQMLMPNPAIRSGIQALLSATTLLDTGSNVSDFTRQVDSIQYGLIQQAYVEQTNALRAKAAAAAEQAWNQEYSFSANAYKEQYKDYYNHYIDYKTNVFLRTGYEDPQNPSLGFKSIDEYWNNSNNRSELIWKTRSAAIAIYLGRTALSFFSPLSLQTTQVNPSVSAYIKSLNDAGYDNEKLRKVLVEHPEFISFAMAHRTVSGVGTPLQATVDVQMFQEKNADLFSKGENLAGLYVFTPWSKKYSEFSSKEYKTQKTTGARKQLDMNEFILNMARQTGNWFVYDYIPNAAPENYPGTSADASKYGSINLAWSQAQGDASKSRARAFREVETILSIPGIDKREGFNKTVPVIRSIISLYRDYQNRLDRAAPGNSQVLQSQWVSDLQGIENDHPEATYAIETLFKNMKLRDVK